MGILGLDTVAIVVSDRHEAIRWYRDVLGLAVAYIGPSPPNPDPSVQGTPDRAGHWIELGPRRPLTRVHLCQMDETEPGPTGITFLTDDILKDYARLTAAGVEFPMPPEKMEWGEWLGQFADPDGNVFDFKQPMSMQIGAPTRRLAPRARDRGGAPRPRTKRPRRTGPSS
jgi:uncharacterized glyoxalase superfamily protein PhnB